MARTLLGEQQLREGLAKLAPGWSVSGSALVRTVTFPSFLTAVAFVTEMAPAAERLDHHPDLALSWRTVKLSLSTHSAGGLTELDLALAGELDAIIDRLSEPGSQG
jgi:4a-hydroxytetrahydrobiopterin dehydratase